MSTEHLQGGPPHSRFNLSEWALTHRSLVLYLIVHLLPFALALTGDPLSIATVALIILCRVILFGAVGYPLWNAVLLHPLMVVLSIYILLRSVWFVGIRGELRWRGRVYDAARTRFGGDR